MKYDLFSRIMKTELNTTENLRISGLKQLATLKAKEKIPLTDDLTNQITKHRKIIRDIIHKSDKRLLVVIGPCSIHDPIAAFDYAKRLVRFQKLFLKNILS